MFPSYVFLFICGCVYMCTHLYVYIFICIHIYMYTQGEIKNIGAVSALTADEGSGYRSLSGNLAFRTDDLQKAIQNKEYRKKLYQEYRIERC